MARESCQSFGRPLKPETCPHVVFSHRRRLVGSRYEVHSPVQLDCKSSHVHPGQNMDRSTYSVPLCGGPPSVYVGEKPFALSRATATTEELAISRDI
jgi:hypothetical protein